MSSSREAFLERVRRAVRAGNRLGHAAALGPRGRTGYQGADPDPSARFCEELAAAGGHAHPVADKAAAIARVLELVQASGARNILLGCGSFLDSLELMRRLPSLGCNVVRTDRLPAGDRDPLFAADLAISGVDYLVAETGTVVLLARAAEPRSLSLLPPIHIAVAHRGQLVPDLFDLFESDRVKASGELPSCVSLITGPSKTGDIELRLVTGVHGPGQIHVVLCESDK
jgi:L-lactate utilization protein LutC